MQKSLILYITVFTLIFSDHFPHASDINSLLVRTILYQPEKKKYILWYYSAAEYINRIFFRHPIFLTCRTEHEPICIFQPRSALHPAELERHLPHFFKFFFTINSLRVIFYFPFFASYGTFVIFQKHFEFSNSIFNFRNVSI